MKKNEFAYGVKGFKVQVLYREHDEIIACKTFHVNTEHPHSASNYLSRITDDLKHADVEITKIEIDKNTISRSNEPYRRYLFTPMRNVVRLLEHGEQAYDEIYSKVYDSKDEMLANVISEISDDLLDYHNAYHDYVKRNSLFKIT